MWNYFERDSGPAGLMYQALLLDLPSAPRNVAVFSSLAIVGLVADAESVNLPAGSKATIYIMVVGPAGSGKTFTLSHAVERLSRMGLNISHTGMPSREGLAAMLSEEKIVVNIADEVQDYFRSKKKGSYLADTIEMWKRVWDRKTVVLTRRRKEASITVPADSRLVVLASTTPNDFDEVREGLDPALLRRMLILKTDSMVNMYMSSKSPLETMVLWRVAASMLMFLKRVRWVLWLCSQEGFLNLAKVMASFVGQSPEVISFLQQYSIRLGMILALNDIAQEALEITEVELREDPKSVSPDVFSSMMYERFKLRYRRDGLPKSSEMSGACGFDHGEVLSRLRMLGELYRKGELNCERVAEVVENVLQAPSQRPKVIAMTPSDEVFVTVPSNYILKGLALAFYTVVDGLEFRVATGLDPLVSKIIRVACRAKEQGKPITMRELSRGTGKRYNDLLNSLRAAITAGFLSFDECQDSVMEDDLIRMSERALRQCTFKVDDMLC